MVYFSCQVFAFATWALSDHSSLSHDAAKIMHIFFHIAGITTLISGMAAVVAFMNPPDSKPSEVSNLSSVHQWIGVAAILVFGVNFLLGSTMGVYTACTSPETRKQQSSIGSNLLLSHRIVGVTSLLFAGCAIITGVQQFLEGGVCEESYDPNYHLTKMNFAAVNNGSNAESDSEEAVASNYGLLNNGCRRGNSLGITIIITLFFVMATLIVRMQLNFSIEKFSLLKAMSPSDNNLI